MGARIEAKEVVKIVEGMIVAAIMMMEGMIFLMVVDTVIKIRHTYNETKRSTNNNVLSQTVKNAFYCCNFFSLL